jgi:hypothetical protein
MAQQSPLRAFAGSFGAADAKSKFEIDDRVVVDTDGLVEFASR